MISIVLKVRKHLIEKKCIVRMFMKLKLKLISLNDAIYVLRQL